MRPKKSTYTVDKVKSKMEHYCAYQERSHREVERKLREYQMIPEAEELILLHLIQENYLNEERYARHFTRGKFRVKNWGRVRIRRELKMKGVSSHNIRVGLSEIEEEEYRETLEKLARKKSDSIRESNPWIKRKKLSDFLLRRGFESDMVYAMVRDLNGENE